MFGLGMGFGRVQDFGDSGDNESPTLSNLAVDYDTADDTDFDATGESSESTGNAYILFVTKGAGATAKETVKATADFTAVISGGTFTLENTVAMMGVEDADVVIEDASGNLSTVTRLVIYNHDAQAFFTTYSISDNTIRAAVNRRTTDLKAGQINGSDIWAKRIQLCPIVGGDATKHAGDLSGNGNTLVFIGSPTHDANGVNTTGTEYAQSGLIPNVDLTENDICVSYYLAANPSNNNFHFGSNAASFANEIYGRRRSDGNMQLFYLGIGANTAIAGEAGHIVWNIKSSSAWDMWQNGTKDYSRTGAAEASSLSAQQMFIMALNNNGTVLNPIACNLRSWDVFILLTDDELEDLNDLEERFQDALSRGVV